MTTLLHIEVANRLRAMPDANRVHPVLDLMRVVVEVVEEFREISPESIKEFLDCFPAPRAN
jgi:hypothetical protein